MDLACIPAEPTEADIESCVGALLAGEQAGHGIEIMTWHAFAPGLVARTVLLEAGTVVASVLHKVGHVIVFAGDCTVIGPGLHKRFAGYHVAESMASEDGKRRVVIAHADTWITTIHSNHDDCQDVQELARRYVGDPENLQQNRFDLPAPPVMEALQ